MKPVHLSTLLLSFSLAILSTTGISAASNQRHICKNPAKVFEHCFRDSPHGLIKMQVLENVITIFVGTDESAAAIEHGIIQRYYLSDHSSDSSKYKCIFRSDRDHEGKHLSLSDLKLTHFHLAMRVKNNLIEPREIQLFALRLRNKDLINDQQADHIHSKYISHLKSINSPRINSIGGRSVGSDENTNLAALEEEFLQARYLEAETLDFKEWQPKTLKDWFSDQIVASYEESKPNCLGHGLATFRPNFYLSVDTIRSLPIFGLRQPLAMKIHF